MTHIPQAPQGTDLLQALCEQLEIMWNEHRDATLVDRLAADHPEFAGALYEFFGILVQAELDLDRHDSTLADADTRARTWLDAGGYEQVAEAARRHATPPSTAGAGTPTLSPIATPSRGGAQASPGREQSDSPRMRTPAAGSPAAGVPPGSPLEAGPGSEPASGRARKRTKRRTFLGLLIDVTGETPEAIAADLGVNANFLVGVDDLRDEMPARARDELAGRAEQRYQIARATGLEHLSPSGMLPIAASRGAAYEKRLTYREVVRQAKMAAADEAFWLSLADPAPQIPE